MMRDFTIESTVHEGPRSVVLRATDPTGTKVVLKRPRSARPGVEARAALEAEHALLRQFSHPQVVRAEALVQDGLRPVLVMRDAGAPLAQHLLERRPDLTESLRIAREVARALEAVHARGFVHRDVHPGNILIDEAGQVTLADLGLAAPVEREAPAGRSPRLIGQLRYVAPEQTGRTGGGVDERSDLYALGAVLFEMLTGRVPFSSVDPGELVHAHLAQRAPALRSVDPRLPEVLERLVARLLHKRPGARYQTARGLAEDLGRLLEQAETDGELGGFDLGAADDLPEVRQPDELFAREAAGRRLDEAVHRSGEGARVLLRIEGAAGAGKTALVGLLERKIADTGRRVLVGGYSSDRADQPLSGFAELLRKLLQEALTYDEGMLEHKRAFLRELIGYEAPLLAAWVPELGTLLQIDAPAPQLEPTEANQRLVRAVGRLVGAMASREHPAALVLEDFEHADGASLELVQSLLCDQDLHYITLVLTHRPEAAQPGGRLSAMLDAVDHRKVEQICVCAEPFDAPTTERWVAAALRAPSAQVAPLARQLFAQTAGNPLALARLLPELVDAGHVRYARASGGWAFDLPAIANTGLGDDVVQVLLSRMRRLPEPTQEILRNAACLGRRFDVLMLADALGMPRREALDALEPAAQAHVVRGVDGLLGKMLTCTHSCSIEALGPVRVEFADERFREAAYEDAPEAARVKTHLRFGRWMRTHLDEAAIGARCFELAAHYEAARDALTPGEERRAAAQVVEKAAGRAAASVAWGRAVALYALAFELLGPDPLAEDYEAAMRVGREAQRILLFVRHLEPPAGLPTPRALFEAAREASHRLDALSIQVIHMCRDGQAEQALALAAEHLAPHGIELLPADADASLAEHWGKIRQACGDDPVTSLADLPEMMDPLQVALLQLVRSSTLATYICRRDLVPHTSMVAVRLSVEHGNGPMSSLSYGDCAVAVIDTLGEREAGLALADVAVKVADKQNAYRAAARVVAAGLAEPYRRPLIEVCDQLQDALRFGRETGETLFQGLGSSFLANYLFMGSLPLDRLQRRYEVLLPEMQRYLGDVGVREVEFTQRAVEVLRGEREYPWDLRIPGDEEAFATAARKNPEGLAWGRLLRGRLAMMHGDGAAAVELVDSAEAWNWRGAGHLNAVELTYYRIAARLSPGAPEDAAQLEALVVEMRAHVVGRWEVNAQHKLRFAEGVLAWLGGRHWQALEHFEAALELAEARRFAGDQGLMAELVARCLQNDGRPQVARGFWQAALRGYEAWSALAQADRVREQLGLEASPGPSAVRAPGVSLSSESDAARVDLEAVIRASQALSQVQGRDALIERLLQLVAESAGAERVALVLEEDGEWLLVARLEQDGLQLESRQLRAVGPAHSGFGQGADAGVLPVGIVNYVTRVGEPVVLTDASRQGRFATDPYIATVAPHAVLVAPIERQGRVVGVLYLENNVSPVAFGADRLELVEVLAAQAAIGMEQARLYEALEAKVEARTRDLADKNRALEASLEREQRMQSRLVVAEKMASLGNLVAGVAHELNTPIGAVASSADTLQRGLDRLEASLKGGAPDERKLSRILSVLRDNQRVVAEGGTRVSEIVRTLRTFAHLDEAERQKADLREGLDSTLRMMQHRLEAVQVRREYAEIPPVECYPHELNQVFMNLVTNAVQAIADRPGAGQVTLRTGASGEGEVWVEVEDDGPGIPAEVEPKIFDPGFTTRGVGVGLGLGLSICFSIVDKHGGRIEAEGRPGLGARMRVVLPSSAATSRASDHGDREIA